MNVTVQGKKMEYLKKIVFNTKMDIKKSTYIWNMIAGLSSALESVLFSMIVTRISGLSDAGIVSIGFTIGNLMATIGKYGVRTFQVTDVSRKYAFSSYLYARILTILLMVLVSGGYIAYCFQGKGYSFYKAAAVALFCFKFVIEALEDVFAGECQKAGRLDASSRAYVLRSVCFVLIFTVSLLIGRNLVAALIATLLVAVVLEGMMLRLIISTMELSLKWQGWRHTGDILIKCFPLFLSAFYFFYITNAPKYAIDTVMNDEVQACYGFIAFPVFAIELLNNFIYQPSLVSLASEWSTRNYGKVRTRIYRQLAVVLGLTVMALIAGYFLGIPVLSLIFSADLTAYKREMLVLLLGGGVLAVIGYLSTILVTMRHSMLMIYGYTVIFAISLFSYTGVIVKYGILGGVILYCLLCFLFALYEYIAITVIFRINIDGD